MGRKGARSGQLIGRFAFAVALAGGAIVPLAAQQPTTQALLDKAAAFVADQLPRLTNVVSEERRVQEITSPRQKRTLVADYLVIRLPETGDFAGFRDVFEVDAKPVRDRDERLQRLFIESPGATAFEQASAIAREGARHNIWNIGTVSDPFLTTAFIQERYQKRFRFQSPRQEKELGPDVWAIQFQEFVTPTILKGDGNRDMFSRGRIWIHAPTGRIVKTELRVGAASARLGLNPIEVLTTFSYDEALQLNLPAELKEYYPDARVGDVRSTATYGRFRRFGVVTTEEIKRAD